MNAQWEGGQGLGLGVAEVGAPPNHNPCKQGPTDLQGLRSGGEGGGGGGGGGGAERWAWVIAPVLASLHAHNAVGDVRNCACKPSLLHGAVGGL